MPPTINPASQTLPALPDQGKTTLDNRPPGQKVLQMPELTQKISILLKDGRDRVRFSSANRRIHAATSAEVQSARLTDQIANVSDLAAFHALLGTETAPNGGTTNTIRSMRLDLQPELLLALAKRIETFPSLQQAARHSWREAVTAQPRLARNPLLQKELEQQEQSTRLADQVADVNTLADIKALLGAESTHVDGSHDSIKNLRPGLRIKPLNALASRIYLLPEDEQSEAISAFVAAAADISEEYHDTGFAKLVRAAREREAPSELHVIAFVNALKNGEAIQDILHRGGVTEPDAIEAMTMIATAIAWGTAVKNGESRQDAAVRLGITDPDTLAEATAIAAEFDIQWGESLQTVLNRYDITDAAVIEEMTSVAIAAAKEAIRDDVPWAEAATRLGITAEDHLNALSLFAGTHDIRNNRQPLQTVITRHNITNADVIVKLESAAKDEATTFIQNQGSWQDAVNTYGITDEDAIKDLRKTAFIEAKKAMEESESTSWKEAAATYGVIEDKDIEKLKGVGIGKAIKTIGEKDISLQEAANIHGLDERVLTAELIKTTGLDTLRTAALRQAFIDKHCITDEDLIAKVTSKVIYDVEEMSRLGDKSLEDIAGEFDLADPEHIAALKNARQEWNDSRQKGKDSLERVAKRVAASHGIGIDLNLQELLKNMYLGDI